MNVTKKRPPRPVCKKGYEPVWEKPSLKGGIGKWVCKMMQMAPRKQ